VSFVLPTRKAAQPLGNVTDVANVRIFPYNAGMPSIKSTAKLTSKSQMTVPIAVRKTLGVGPQDLVVFTIHEGGQVEVAKAETEHTDAIVDKYLAFLDRDMEDHP
jgi:bifunctional DNA-binding transcriptional regulator/antitoxin component of YhaV-PrlF toxin-antitoxin module